MRIFTRWVEWITLLFAFCVVCALSGCGNEGPVSAAPQIGGGPAAQVEGGGPGNGGGAIVRNGNILTLAQAGIEIPITEAPPSDNVEEITVVAALIEKLALNDATRGNLLRSLEPNGARKYFKIESEDLNPEKRAKLLAAYYSAIGQTVPPGDELTLVALTIGSETFLLPEFYQLSDSIARSAILFHEALWVKNPKMHLSSILRAEVAIEKLLRSGAMKEKMIYDFELFQVLQEALENPYLGVVGAVRKDFETGSISILLPQTMGEPVKEVLAKPEFPIVWIFGAATVAEMRVTLGLNRDTLYGYLYYLQKLNPSLKFIREIQGLAPRLRMNFIGDPYCGKAEQTYSWDGYWCEPYFGQEIFDLSQSWDMKTSSGYHVSGFLAQKGTVGRQHNEVMILSLEELER